MDIDGSAVILPGQYCVLETYAGRVVLITFQTYSEMKEYMVAGKFVDACYPEREVDPLLDKKVG